MEECPVPEDLDELVGGSLPPSRAEQIRRHVDECDSYRMVVAQLAQSRNAEVITAREPSQPGAQLGRYRIGKKLGAGGMGVVLLADDTELCRKVVIKLVRPGDSSNENRQRLVREAQAMAQLSHPNVVPIFDVGVFRLTIDEPSLTELTIELGPAAKPRPLPRDVWGEAHVVDPGDIVVVARAPDHIPFKLEESITAGQETTLRVTKLAVARETRIPR